MGIGIWEFNIQKRRLYKVFVPLLDTQNYYYIKIIILHIWQSICRKIYAEFEPTH
jgi:hypothetical protein